MSKILARRSKFLKSLKEAAFVVVVLFLITSWQERGLLDTDGSEQVAPQTLVTLQGTTEPLVKQGKRTLVYFFAPWCNVCELSISNLNDLQSEKLDVVRVALDYQTKNEVERFVKRADVQGRVLLGTEQQKLRFNVPGYPTYYILDEQSNVIASSFGYSTGLGMRLKNYLSGS